MSKTYLRLICNNQKIRSCCNTKWARDEYFSKIYLEKDYDEMSYTDKETYLRFLLLQTPLELRTSKKVFDYTIEVVKKGRDGNKRVIKSIQLKYRIYPHAIPNVYKMEEINLDSSKRNVHFVILTNKI